MKKYSKAQFSVTTPYLDPNYFLGKLRFNERRVKTDDKLWNNEFGNTLIIEKEIEKSKVSVYIENNHASVFYMVDDCIIKQIAKNEPVNSNADVMRLLERLPVHLFKCFQ